MTGDQWFSIACGLIGILSVVAGALTGAYIGRQRSRR